MSQDDPEIQRRKAEKDMATAEIASALSRMMEEHRNPDHWERIYLAYALRSVFAGCYSLAITEARLAMTPPNKRSSTPNLPSDPIFAQCDLPFLLKAMHEAIGARVLLYPHLGPITLTAPEDA